MYIISFIVVSVLKSALVSQQNVASAFGDYHAPW